MTPYVEALHFVDAGIAVARAWGLRASIGRREQCGCNGPGGACRYGVPGAHPLHARPDRTATTAPATINSWADLHAGENLVALTGRQSRVVALTFASSNARRRRIFDFGRLPPTMTTCAPDGSVTMIFRWDRPPRIRPDVLGRGITVQGEGGWTPVPGSALPGGAVTWAADPQRIFALPASWRQGIEGRQAGTPNARIFAHP